jgi:hypothetical protein
MNDENLTSYQPGQSGNPAGKIPGTKNRSTIARKVLEMRAMFPKEKMEALRLIYPEICEQSTVEEMMTIVMASQAIEKGDTNAYKALQDSAYGAPKQEVTGLDGIPLFPTPIGFTDGSAKTK